MPLGGRPLLPGFQDAHVHPAFAGITMLRCDLDGAEDLDGALARIRAYAEAQPDREWIDGSGWRMEWFPGGTPLARAAGPAWSGGPAGLPDQPGRARRLGQLPGAGAGGPDRRAPPTPPDGRIERGAGR